MGIVVVFRKIELGVVMGELSSLNSRCNWLFRGGKSCLSWLGLSLSYYFFLFRIITFIKQIPEHEKKHSSMQLLRP